MPLQRLFFLTAMIFTATPGFALSPEAEEGKAFYPACNVCHDAEQTPPLGPPMWGVQNRYRKASTDDAEFVSKMVAFVKSPSMESALMHNPVKELGLMPPLPLPDEMLKKIAAYILEENFPPPCTHWEFAVKRATEQGDMAHAKKDQKKFDKFCK